MRTLLSMVLLCALNSCLHAQNQVSIQINHLLNGDSYEHLTEGYNNMDQPFVLDRLEYYLSNFSIIHDGGQEMIVPDIYVLVTLKNQTPPTTIDLGSLDIDQLEGIRFHFGVDSLNNHADPTQWPSDHALAPKFPSMHWGWAAGYRFIALEGQSGPNTNQELQFHCIGNEFFKPIEVPVNASDENIMVEIDAEYSNLLKDIDISEGMILHGNLNEIKDLAANMVNDVFTSAQTTSVIDHERISTFKAYPNPTDNGLFSIQLETAVNQHTLEIYDAQGKLVYRQSSPEYRSIQLEEKGLFMLVLRDASNKILASNSVVNP